ncbi:hypothetical protein K474DRAFT_1671564 [Panus rudis PR-1116 ss-1]|nr:hypothetical protein K474DRAFT_1671564 [Panus rudis PR-1116 ss-1]
MLPTNIGASGSRRPSLHTTLPPSFLPESYSDSRGHAPQGPTRHVRVPRVTTYGGGSIAKSEDGTRCVIAGKESLRVLRVTEPNGNAPSNTDHRTVVGRGGYRMEVSRNLWTGSGLKVDAASTDVTWAYGSFSNKVLTSARNGELIMWDLQKQGPSKYDGDLRVWDLRAFTKSVLKVHHPTSVRAVVISPVSWQPLQAITGLDNGSIYRWDLTMGQRGQLDRIPVAHSKPIISLDWTLPQSTISARSAPSAGQNTAAWYGGMGAGLFDDIGGFGMTSGPATNANTAGSSGDGEGTSMGWLASGGLDRCVKVWDLTTTSAESHISRHPAYTLHTSFPVRRVAWRSGPAYECEIAVVSNSEFGTGSGSLDASSPPTIASPQIGGGLPAPLADSEESLAAEADVQPSAPGTKSDVGDPVEIWDVRRGYIAKWAIRGSAVEGGVTDIVFSDPHALWAQHVSGSFSQFDLRQMSKPLDAVTKVATTWDATGSMFFVADKPRRWEIPYDDIHPDRWNTARERKAKLKALGDKPYVPVSQTMGMVGTTGLLDDMETFVELAKGYIFQGPDRKQICSHNAEVALNVGKHDAAQAWLLLQSLLVDVRPAVTTTTSARSLSPLPIVSNPGLPHCTSAPAEIPTTNRLSSATSTTLAHQMRSVSVDEHMRPHRKTSGSRSTSSRQSPEKPSAPSSIAGYLSPRRITPASSAQSSPHRGAVSLPPSVPPSVFARRGSNTGLATFPIQTTSAKRPRLLSQSYHPKRPSAPVMHNAQSESPSDMSIKSGPLSNKHLGEGALDDSDDEDEDRSQRGGSDADSDIEDYGLQDSFHSDRSNSYFVASPQSGLSETLMPPRPPISPYLYPRTSRAQSYSHHNHPNPSPLSRVAGRQGGSEDEEDKDGDDSPSPASSSNSEYGFSGDDTEGSISRARTKRVKLQRRGSKSAKKPLRSRSSTVASYVASAPPTKASSSLSVQPPKLVKQNSQSSIRTVTAVNSPLPEHESGSNGLRRDDTIRNLSSGTPTTSGATDFKSALSQHPNHRRMRSAISTEFSIGDARASRGTSRDRQSSLFPKRRDSSLTKEQSSELEARVREVGWQALRESIDVFADEGDVQMCAVLSLVAGNDLRISRSRLMRFLESYIEILSRLKLHAVAAYVRKYSPIEEVRNTTSGKFSEVFDLECYQKYYMNRPMIELTHQLRDNQPQQPASSTLLPPSTPSLQSRPLPRGRTLSKVTDSGESDDGVSSRHTDGLSDGGGTGGAAVNPIPITILGHPCAAGCGHYCWAANGGLYPQIVEDVE